MALLDIFSGSRAADGTSGRVPPLAKALAGLLSYGKLKDGSGADYSERLEDFFAPSPTGGPTSKGVIGALLTLSLIDI